MGDIVRCCSLERAAAAVDAALHCIIQMCASANLQVRQLADLRPGLCSMAACSMHIECSRFVDRRTGLMVNLSPSDGTVALFWKRAAVR